VPRKFFGEFMEILPKGLNPLKLQTNFKLIRFLFFYYSNSVRNLDFSQKGSLFLSNSYCTMPSFEMFGAPEATFLYFTS
jgi:hypothetical protein